MERVIILNGDYTFLNTVNWKRAMCLMEKGKTQVVKYSDKIIHCVDGSFRQLPAVMKLIKVIRMIYRNRVPYSKRNIMIRDGYHCVYCDSHKKLTIDHMVPTSRGGKTSFENCVAACRACNSKKGNKTPSQAKMFMRKKPYAPTISEFFRIKMKMLGVDKYLKELGVY